MFLVNRRSLLHFTVDERRLSRCGRKSTPQRSIAVARTIVVLLIYSRIFFCIDFSPLIFTHENIFRVDLSLETFFRREKQKVCENRRKIE